MNILLIDTGHKYLKFVLVAIHPNGAKEVKYIKILDFEDKNNNIHTREINRTFEYIQETATIDEVIVLPKKTDIEGKTHVFEVEYNDNKSIMNKNIKDIMLDNLSLETSYVSDHTVQIDAPDKDFKLMLSSSLSYDVFFHIISTLNNLKVSKYRILLKEQALSMLVPDDGKVYCIADVGHDTTTSVICRYGMVLDSRTFTGSGGKTIRRGLSGTTQEVDILKHQTPFHSLLTASSTDMIAIVSSIRSHMESYDNVKIKDYILVGGTANLELETIDELKTFNRIQPNIVTHVKSPLSDLTAKIHTSPHTMILQEPVDETILNIIAPIFGAVKLTQTPIDLINFASPKDGGIGIQIKEIMKIHQKITKPLHNLILGSLALIIFLVSASIVLDNTVQKQIQVRNKYSNELSNVENTYNRKMEEWNKLLEQEPDYVQSNIGILQEKIAERVPPTLSIKSIESEYMREFIIEGYSNSDLAIADFMDFLELDVFKEVMPIVKKSVKGYDGNTVEYFRILARGVL